VSARTHGNRRAHTETGARAHARAHTHTHTHTHTHLHAHMFACTASPSHPRSTSTSTVQTGGWVFRAELHAHRPQQAHVHPSSPLYDPYSAALTVNLPCICTTWHCRALAKEGKGGQGGSAELSELQPRKPTATITAQRGASKLDASQPS
jgi:hypothetical protein